MQIADLTLYTTDLAAQRSFYSQILGFPVVAASRSVFTVAAGVSCLTFAQAAGPLPSIYHFAFNIPHNQLAEAYAWAKVRTPLATDEQGRDTFDFKHWNAHALYFLDPAGNIVECIARSSLPNASDRPFDSGSIQNVSEIGLATLDVRDTVERLTHRLGIGVYDGKGSDEFSAVGDEHGLFIIVRGGRFWYPTRNMPADLVPLRVVLSNGTVVEQTGTELNITLPDRHHQVAHFTLPV